MSILQNTEPSGSIQSPAVICDNHTEDDSFVAGIISAFENISQQDGYNADTTEIADSLIAAATNQTLPMSMMPYTCHRHSSEDIEAYLAGYKKLIELAQEALFFDLQVCNMNLSLDLLSNCLSSATTAEAKQEYRTQLERLHKSYREVVNKSTLVSKQHQYLAGLLPNILTISQSMIKWAVLVETKKCSCPDTESNLFHFFELTKIYFLNGEKYLDKRMIRVAAPRREEAIERFVESSPISYYKSLDDAQKDFLERTLDLEVKHQEEVVLPITNATEAHYSIYQEMQLRARLLDAYLEPLPGGSEILHLYKIVSLGKNIKISHINYLLDNIINRQEYETCTRHFMNADLDAHAKEIFDAARFMVFMPIDVLMHRFTMSCPESRVIDLQ